MPETVSTVSLSRGGAVTMVIDAPTGATQGSTPVVVLAHGAGNDLRSGFLELFASKLSAAGLVVVRFNFPYKERGGTRPPDKMDVLVDCYADVVAAQERRTGATPATTFLGGKSMGARVASILVAEGRAKPAGLVFLGYPLHPQGDPTQLRVEHLPDVKKPMLFVQGTKDPFCEPALLKKIRAEQKLPGALFEIEGGGHSYEFAAPHRPKQAAAMESAAGAVVRFVKKVLDRGKKG